MSLFCTRFLYRTLLISVFIAACSDSAVHAQASGQSPDWSVVSSALPRTATTKPGISDQAALLPDAPGLAMLHASAHRASVNDNDPPDHDGAAVTNGLGSVTAQASHTQKYIEPGQIAPSLSANDKVLLGVRDAFSLFSVSAWIASAGYAQLVNGSPNYGTDRGAFGQRLGAGAIRDITEGVFCDSVMSPLLREDPRYYRLGPSHNFFARAAYAATRPLITRTDGGRLSPNLALIAGNAGGSALTNVYYPQLNRGVTQTLETFGGSMGGSALGDAVSEFYDDVVHPHRHR